MKKILSVCLLAAVAASAATPKRLKFDIADAGKTLEGLFIGALNAEGFGDVVHCLKDVEDIGENVITAVKDFESKTASGIEKGIMAIGKAVEDVASGMNDCKNIPKDIDKLKKMALVFKSPWSVVYHIGKDLLVNGIQIYHDINNAIMSFKAGDYEKFGEYVGQALAKTILGTPEEAVKTKSLSFDIKALESTLEGILIGALDAEGMSDIVSCVKDATTIGGDIYTAVEDFEKGGYTNIKNGIMEIGKAVEMVAQGMTDCKTIPKDLDKLKKMAAIFSSPTSFVYHVAKDLIVNGVQIYKEINQAIAYYKQSNYKMFGEEVGTALAKTILGQQKKSVAKKNVGITLQQVGQIMEGIMVGALNAEGFQDIVNCFDDVETFGADIYDAVQNFKHHDYTHTKNGIEDIGKAIIGVANGVKDCKNLPKDWERITKMAAIFASPHTFLWHLGKDLILNGFSIYKEIKAAVGDYEHADYMGFGKNVGMALAKTVLGSSGSIFMTMSPENHATFEMINSYTHHTTGGAHNPEPLYNDMRQVGKKFIFTMDSLAHDSVSTVRNTQQAAQMLNVLGANLIHAFSRLPKAHLRRFNEKKLEAELVCLTQIKAAQITDKGVVQDIINDYKNGNFRHIGKHIHEAVQMCQKANPRFATQ